MNGRFVPRAAAALAAIAFIALGWTPPAHAQADGDVAELTATVRDFSEDHPDFEESGGSSEAGIVEDEIGADRKPVYAHGDDGSATTSGQDNFDEWFNDVDGVNFSREITIELVRQDNLYSFVDEDFFPLDDDEDFGWGFEGQEHNFWFTLEMHTQFTYEGNEIFAFNGDDDVFVYVNDRLVVDLGGIHLPETGSVDLNSQADDLGLEVGETYPLDFFFVERHTFGSTFSILTSLQLVSDSAEPSVWDGLREPGDIGFDGKRAVAAVALASLLLLIVFPAELFNGTLEANYDEVKGWFRRGNKQPKPKPPPSRSLANVIVPIVVIGLLGALLNPDLGFDGESFAWAFGAIAAVVIGTMAPIALAVRRQADANVRPYPGSLGVAALTVLVSRLTNFVPGYLYGTAGGVEFEDDDAARDGKAALRDVVLVAGIATVAWFLWALVHTGAPSRAVPIRAIEATLVNLYGIGWAGLLLGLLPLRFLPGRDLYEWRKSVWAGVTGVVAAGLLYTSALPDDDGYDGSLALVLGLFLGFAALSVGFWAYFRFRKPKEAAAAIAAVIPKEDTTPHR